MIKGQLSERGEITVTLSPVFEADLGDYQLVNIGQGPDGEILLLAVHEPPELIEDRFPEAQTERPFHYKIIRYSGGGCEEISIPDQHWNFHFVQPIDGSNYLLAAARCTRYDDGTADLNAKVYGPEGNLVREFLLGDGIEHLFVTEQNNIWTAYFDEGIFGNYGWDEPVGSAGLIRWDAYGNRLYEYPNGGKHHIIDCYAMNVCGDRDVWFYYYNDYNDFELARYRDGALSYWKTDVESSTAFLVHEPYILFKAGWDDNRFVLFEMGKKGKLKRKARLSFLDEKGKEIPMDILSCRRSQMAVFHEDKVYVADLEEILKMW